MTQLDILATGTAFDAIKHTDERGDYWLARELQPLMGYERWEAFAEAIQRAHIATRNCGMDPDLAFSPRHEKGTGGRGRNDFRLTRYAAYMTALNGDPRKPEVAAAQSYFVVKTHEAETGVAIPRPRRELTNRELAQMVIEEADRADRAEASLAIAAPKADAWEVLASAEGDMSVREAAFVLNRDPNISTGQNRLFAKLQELTWIDKRKVPYASHERHVRLRVYTYDDPVTREPVTRQQVRVTAEGLRLLHKKLGGTSPLSHLMPVDPPAA